MKITLRDVAAACEMDISTVSRALRDDERVKPQTRKRIREVAEQLGYQPNFAARSLVAGRTRTIWFIEPSLHNITEQAPVECAGRRLLVDGYALLIALFHDDDDNYRDLILRLQQGVADGAVILPGPQNQRELFAPLLKRGYPLIFLDRHDEGVDIPVVTTANADGAAELVRLGVKEGARAIVSVFDRNNPVEKERRRGVEEAARDAGIPLLYPEGLAGVISSLPHCVAVIGSSEGCCRELSSDSDYVEEFRNRELIFATFDRWSSEPYPGKVALVCVQDFKRMGEVAVEEILRMIDGKRPERAIFKIAPLDYQIIRPEF